MQRADLASKLISAKTNAERNALLTRNKLIADVRLARKIKDLCYAAWTTEPTRAQYAARSLRTLKKIKPHPEIEALSFWIDGISDITKGKLESAIENFDHAAREFKNIDKHHEAAETQVPKLMALALLGRYEDAIRTGEEALKIFEKYRDHLAAAKIEMNLANMFSRREMHRESEKYGLAARRHFAKIKEKTWQAMAENGLAITYSQLNDFRRAEKFYAQALATAREAKMFVTEAEIEASMGNLALMRGRYADALKFLELSRQKYAALNMPHNTAVAELEIADIYEQLNLIEEAFEIFERVAGELKNLRLRREEARARSGLGRTAAAVRKKGLARSELGKAAKLYNLENNWIGSAAAKLDLAFLELSDGAAQSALRIADEVEETLNLSENPRHKLTARWLRAEALARSGKHVQAARLLSDLHAEARKFELMPIVQASLNSLGKIAFESGKNAEAEKLFKRAISFAEKLRSPLGAEEFRMAFLAMNLEPFENLVNLYLSAGKIRQAFLLAEKSRSRSLTESLGALPMREVDVPRELKEKTAALREELNWFYNRQSRAFGDELAQLRRETLKREKALADVMRQIESLSSSSRQNGEALDFKLLQQQIGPGRVLIEYIKTGGMFSTFVVTEKKIHFVRDLASQSEIAGLLENLQFQFASLRYGARLSDVFERQLKERTDWHLQALYERLVAPLENYIDGRDLIIVPAGVLHYLPFHAFHDGDKYLIEKREVVYSPAASVWQILDKKPVRKIKNALLLGFADEKIPLVEVEIAALKKKIPHSKTLTSDRATFAGYTANAPKYDLLHLACHGNFRPENPMFSSLHLADGWITARDIYSQRLKAALVTLSACETGLNKIFAGDEILGLARGFLAAGADSLVLSLWTVNDEATRELMADFYENLQRGASIAASLRLAQTEFIRRSRHPYFWSPFVYIGR